MENTNKSIRRRHEAFSIGSVLENTTLPERINPRLGRVSRLYRLIVGPTLSLGSTPVALYGTCVTIAVASKALQSQLVAIEEFVLKTLSERLESVHIRSIEYVVNESMQYPEAVELPSLAAEKTDVVASAEIVEMASTIPDEKLREAAIQWMSVLNARTQEDV